VVGLQVILIGRHHVRQAYGFYPQDNCGTTYFSIEFKGVNQQGFGDYPDGFSPANATGTVGVQIPGCAVADDFHHVLGDSSEARLAAALGYLTSATCPAPILLRILTRSPVVGAQVRPVTDGLLHRFPVPGEPHPAVVIGMRRPASAAIVAATLTLFRLRVARGAARRSGGAHQPDRAAPCRTGGGGEPGDERRAGDHRRLRADLGRRADRRSVVRRDARGVELTGANWAARSTSGSSRAGRGACWCTNGPAGTGR